MLDFLIYQLVAQPLNLVNHTRRILLANALGDGEAVLAGLADLFVAVANRAPDLKRNLLLHCRNLLSEEDARWLETALDSGFSAQDVRLPQKCCLARKLRSSLRAEAFFS